MNSVDIIEYLGCERLKSDDYQNRHTTLWIKIKKLHGNSKVLRENVILKAFEGKCMDIYRNSVFKNKGI